MSRTHCNIIFGEKSKTVKVYLIVKSVRLLLVLSVYFTGKNFALDSAVVARMEASKRCINTGKQSNQLN